MPKPACVKCQCFYRPKRNGVHVVEGMPNGSVQNPLPGKLQKEAWMPYKVWSAALWECPSCGHQLIAGYGGAPLAIRHEPEFAFEVASGEIMINDC